MTDIYLVIVEDRHLDVEVLPFSTEYDARARAELLLQRYGQVGPAIEAGNGLNSDMVANGWIYYVEYSLEGDSIRIIKRQLDGAS